MATGKALEGKPNAGHPRVNAFAIIAATVAVNFCETTGKLRPELHSSGFGAQICSCGKDTIAEVKSLGMAASRTHDWALVNPGERVCDYFHIFPLMHLDAKDPKNYVFGPTDYLLKRTREELGHDIFFRLGSSIEHSGPNVHFNTLIPDDFDKVAEIFAATVRHYNCGWANGYKWGIKYWEIWNEPEGHNNMWCLPDGDGDRNSNDPALKADFEARTKRRMELFVKFFVNCLKRIKTEFPDVKVGGPAFGNMNIAKQAYLRKILDACRKEGVAPDFISWHHYTSSPESIMRSIDKAREICDEFGLKDCELIVDEWHFLGEYGWTGLRSADPVEKRRAWEGPQSHIGIDSTCFTLKMLSLFQTSKLDQAYFYGCRNTGTFGYMDERRNKYKIYWGLKIFGDFVNALTDICPSSASDGLTVIAARNETGSRKGFIITDYRAGTKGDIVVNIKGVDPGLEVYSWVLDDKRDMERIYTPIVNGKIILRKADEGSAAFYVMF